MNIRKARENEGMSQRELAEKVNCSSGTISNCENNKCCSPEMREKIEKYFVKSEIKKDIRDIRSKGRKTDEELLEEYFTDCKCYIVTYLGMGYGCICNERKELIEKELGIPTINTERIARLEKIISKLESKPKPRKRFLFF